MLTHHATGAHAACTNPDRAIGRVVYSEDNNLFQGCTARGWMVLHHGVTASSGGGPLTQVGTISTTALDGARSVAVSGSYAYVASLYADSLTVIDISNPAVPVQVGTVSTVDLDGAASVAVSGSYAYVTGAFAGSLTVIDISNPAAPSQVGAVSTPDLGGAVDVAVSGNRAYVASAADSLTVIDISNPAAPVQVGAVSTPDLVGARGVAVSGSYAYVASIYTDSLTVIDISNPAAPVQVGTVSTADLEGAASVAVSGGYAYVAGSYANSLTIIDISNPAAPAQVGTISSPDIELARVVVVSGGNAYVASSAVGSLTVIDISNPAAPPQVGTISTADLEGAFGVAVSGTYAYVAAANADSLTVIDLGSGGDCTGPARPSGGIVFNADHDVFQGCAGGQWVAFHSPATPGGATDCAAPAKPVGALFFNEDYDVFQGCTTRGWKAFHAVGTPPPVLCTNIGDVCGDGSIFAGDTNMYVTDVNQSTGILWSTENVDTGADSATDGAANQAWIVTNETLSEYPAFELCQNLNRHGHSDWYLPARDELDVLYTNQAAIGGFTTAGYWSSTETSSNDAWMQNFLNGNQVNNPKASGLSSIYDIRCVRRNDTTPDAFSFEGEIDVATSTLIESDVVEISGMDDGTAVSITGDGSPEYRICDDASCSTVNHSWTSGSGTIDAGEYLQLRLTSHAAGGAMHSATVTVGTESDQWDVTTGSSGPAGCPNIGDLCSDGSIFAGDMNMYAADVDQSAGIQWSTEAVNTGADSWTDGAANQAWIVANETLGQYPAFELCENLNRHGHTDWYVPARDELDHLYTNRTAIGAFTTGGYWSSTENTSSSAWEQYFMDGDDDSTIKSYLRDVRCVRRTAPGP